jgi:hypothetical protein
VKAEENMATGLYVLQDGSVMVAYGRRHITISCAEYKANGYRPALEKLVAKPAAGRYAQGPFCGSPIEWVAWSARNPRADS